MISPMLVEEVKRLLTIPGISQRRVAQLTGVSRASVGAIAAGRRRDYPPRCNPDDDEPAPQGPAARCRCCGGMVYLPCRLCRVRSIKKRENQKAQERAILRRAVWEYTGRGGDCRS